MPEWFINILLHDKLILKNNIWTSKKFDDNKGAWSFSHEWKAHAATNQVKTWDMTAEERLRKFFIETQTQPGELPGKMVLDAGCGNGQLTKAIGHTGAYVAGIDRHDNLPTSDKNVQFVQADFDDPPFRNNSFDIIIANGSIHHTKNTFHSFQSLAKLVKQHGKLYVWVYKKQTGFNGILLKLLDLSRFFISRSPAGLQRFFVNILTFFFFSLSRIRKGENSSRSKDEIRINVYDAFTPRYRYYHSTDEIRNWFLQCGFEQIAVTHSNNRYGFGMVGTKIKALD